MIARAGYGFLLYAPALGKLEGNTMSEHSRIQSYVNDLLRYTETLRKKQYIPTGPAINLLFDLAEKYNFNEQELISEVIPQLPQYGIQLITVEEEDYLYPGTPNDIIKDTFIKIIESENLDIDTMYYLGTDEFKKQNEKLFDRLGSITFFAIKELELTGFPVVIRTHDLLREAFREYHFEHHPEDREKDKGWIDQETLDIIQPFIKDGCIPSWVAEEVVRDLMIEFGNYPLSQSILETTLLSKDIKILILPKEFWLPCGSEQLAVKEKIKSLLITTGVQLEDVFKQGTRIINHDIVDLARNILFLADASLNTLYDAGIVLGGIITTIVQEEHRNAFPDEVVSESIDRELATSLKVYAKDGYVPGWVVLDWYYEQMLHIENVSAVSATRDATLKSLSLTPLMLSNENYLSPGTPENQIKDKIITRISTWDLDWLYENGRVPSDNNSEHIELVNMILFAHDEIHTRESANQFFWDTAFEAILRHRQVNKYNDVPESVIKSIENTYSNYTKAGCVPSWLRDSVIEVLTEYVKYNQYANLLVDQLLQTLKIEELEVNKDDYLDGCSSETLYAHIVAIIQETEIDVEFYSQFDKFKQEDLGIAGYLCNICYFACSHVTSYDDAIQELFAILDAYLVQDFKS